MEEPLRGAIRRHYPESLCGVVQRNCDISDARHASDYSLCVYLLKMREYYRWEMGYPFSVSMTKDEVGNWLTAREHLWETIQEEPYSRIDVGAESLDPFDTERINDALLPKGYVYSGGIGRKAIPHFFLGRLQKRIDHANFTVLISADECARDLTAPPAMTLGKTIFVRRESVKRMIWEKVQEWRWQKTNSAMTHAMSFYDFDGDLDDALERMTDNELQAVTLHEIGEIMASEYLGDTWGEMLVSLPRSRGEIMARAVRDHLADSLSTLPKLLETANQASLHFFLANLTAMRRDLYPGFLEAYKNWLETQNLAMLKSLIAKSRGHWLAVAQEMLDLHRRHGTRCVSHMEKLIESRRL